MDDSACVSGQVHEGADDHTIALLHSLALDRSIWDRHVPELTEHATVVTCDLPGHGRSCAVEAITVEEMADEVARFLGDLALGPVVVAGLSLGGCVAQALTVRHPDLVKGVVLVDTTAWYGPDAREKWDGRAEKAAQDGLDSLAGFQLARWFSPGFNERNSEVGESLLSVFRANELSSYQAACRALGAVDLRDDVASIAVPAAVLVGELDPATSPDMARDLATRIPDATLRIIDGCSHLSPVERPDAFVEAVVAVLGRVR